MFITIENGLINGGSEINNSRFWTENNYQVEVSEELYNTIMSAPGKYKYDTETKNFIENADYEAEQAQFTREKQTEEIKERLRQLDEQRIRAIAEPSIKDEQTGETWLEYYNKQVQILRMELNELEK